MALTGCDSLPLNEKTRVSSPGMNRSMKRWNARWTRAMKRCGIRGLASQSPNCLPALPALRKKAAPADSRVAPVADGSSVARSTSAEAAHAEVAVRAINRNSASLYGWRRNRLIGDISEACMMRKRACPFYASCLMEATGFSATSHRNVTGAPSSLAVTTDAADLGPSRTQWVTVPAWRAVRSCIR